MPHPQFTLRALLVATALVGVALAAIKFIFLIPGRNWNGFLPIILAFHLSLMTAGAAFGGVVGMVIGHRVICATVGAILLSVGGWALAIVWFTLYFHT